MLLINECDYVPCRSVQPSVEESTRRKSPPRPADLRCTGGASTAHPHLHLCRRGEEGSGYSAPPRWKTQSPGPPTLEQNRKPRSYKYVEIKMLTKMVDFTMSGLIKCTAQTKRVQRGGETRRTSHLRARRRNQTSHKNLQNPNRISWESGLELRMPTYNMTVPQIPKRITGDRGCACLLQNKRSTKLKRIISDMNLACACPLK